MMKASDDAVRTLYDESAKSPLVWYLDALFGRTTENSTYRKRAIAALKLTSNSVVLDIACGTGLNFKIIESYLGDNGRLVGVDLSSGVLSLAGKLVRKRQWTNVELVNASITDYEPGFLFDAVLCTLAMTIIPDYQAAIHKAFDLLKPQGRYAMIGMKSSSQAPYKLLNPFMAWVSRRGHIDLQRDVTGYIRSRCSSVDYEECFGGFYYILSTSKGQFSQSKLRLDI